MILDSMFLVIGWPQILIIVAIVLLLFGGKKIPELMRGLGGGLKEFKKATQDEDEEDSTNHKVEGKSDTSASEEQTQTKKNYSTENK